MIGQTTAAAPLVEWTQWQINPATWSATSATSAMPLENEMLSYHTMCMPHSSTSVLYIVCMYVCTLYNQCNGIRATSEPDKVCAGQTLSTCFGRRRSRLGKWRLESHELMHAGHRKMTGCSLGHYGAGLLLHFYRPGLQPVQPVQHSQPSLSSDDSFCDGPDRFSCLVRLRSGSQGAEVGIKQSIFSTHLSALPCICHQRQRKVHGDRELYMYNMSTGTYIHTPLYIHCTCVHDDELIPKVSVLNCSVRRMYDSNSTKNPRVWLWR